MKTLFQMILWSVAAFALFIGYTVIDIEVKNERSNAAQKAAVLGHDSELTWGGGSPGWRWLNQEKGIQVNGYQQRRIVRSEAGDYALYVLFDGTLRGFAVFEQQCPPGMRKEVSGSQRYEKYDLSCDSVGSTVMISTWFVASDYDNYSWRDNVAGFEIDVNVSKYSGWDISALKRSYYLGAK